MKAKKTVAVLVCTALAVAGACSFAGCKEKRAELDISDYAIEYTQEVKIKEGYTKLTELISYYDGNTFGNGLILIGEKASGGSAGSKVYGVYSTKYEKYIVKNLDARPSSFSFGSSYGEGVKTYDRTEDGTTYNLYAPDGTVIFNQASDINSYVRSIYGYVNGAEQPSAILMITGWDNSEENKSVTKYVEAKRNAESNLYDFKVLKPEEIKMYSSEYNKDEYNTGIISRLYPSTEDEPVEGELSEYKVSAVGNTLTFYKNGDKTGTVDVTNASGVWLAGTNLYYSVDLPVDSNEKTKYNFVEINDGIQTKYDCTLYKYDIAKNKTSELDYEGKVEQIVPVYNRTRKTYDAAAIEGYKFIGGKAYSNLSKFYYLADTNLTCAYDVSDLYLENSGGGLYKLSSDRYYLGDYIVDGNLNVVAKVGYKFSGIENKVYAEGVISFRIDGLYGLKDLSGKIIAEPRYSEPEFYGGNALVVERQPDGNYNNVILSVDGAVRKIELTDSQTLREGEGYYVIADTDEDTLRTVFTFYNYEGGILKTFTESSTLSYNISFTDGISVTENNLTNSTSKTTLYKLS